VPAEGPGRLADLVVAPLGMGRAGRAGPRGRGPRRAPEDRVAGRRFRAGDLRRRPAMVVRSWTALGSVAAGRGRFLRPVWPSCQLAKAS